MPNNNDYEERRSKRRSDIVNGRKKKRHREPEKLATAYKSWDPGIFVLGKQRRALTDRVSYWCEKKRRVKKKEYRILSPNNHYYALSFSGISPSGRKVKKNQLRKQETDTDALSSWKPVAGI